MPIQLAIGSSVPGIGFGRRSMTVGVPCPWPSRNNQSAFGHNRSAEQFAARSNLLEAGLAPQGSTGHVKGNRTGLEELPVIGRLMLRLGSRVAPPSRSFTIIGPASSPQDDRGDAGWPHAIRTQRIRCSRSNASPLGEKIPCFAH